MAAHLDPELRNLDQTITGVGVWHLKLPVNSRRDHGIGTVSDHMEVVVVRLDLDNGMSGWGEAAPWSVFTGTPEGNFAAIDRYFRPLLIGSRLGELSSTLAMLQKIVVHCTEAKSAVETALLDLAGQVLGKPVWQLLGQQCRDRMPYRVRAVARAAVPGAARRAIKQIYASLEHLNYRPGIEALRPATRDELAAYFAEEVADLAELLQRPVNFS